MKKKDILLYSIFSVILCVIAIFIMTDKSYAATTGTYEGMTYEIDETTNEITITKFDTEITGDYKIPERIEGHTVTKISASAFRLTKLTKITIPGTIKEMGREAFSSDKLKEVEFLDGITKIGESSFFTCYGLTKVTIPKSVTHIGRTAFYACTKLTKVELHKDIVVIDSAFNRSGLEEVIIEDGMQAIPEHAFEECIHLKKVNIPNSVKSIGDFAFSGCQVLASLEIPESVTSISSQAFYNWNNKPIYVYPGSYAEQWVKSKYLLYKTYPLKLAICTANTIDDKQYTGAEIKPTVILKDGERILEENNEYTVEYSNNTEIGTATITLTGTGKYTGTKTIQFQIVEEIPTPDVIEGTYNNFSYKIIVETEETIITKYNGSSLYPTIPRTIQGYKVTAIADRAFYNNIDLNEIEIPDTVKTIGAAAFSKCIRLRSVYIPDSVESIGGMAFSTCNSLQNVSLGKGLKEIPYYAFEHCDLQKLEIPDNITSIGSAAFSDCINLKSITIGSGLEQIGMWAFRNCSSVTSLYIPSNIKNIELEAFLNCCGLTSIEVDGNNTAYTSGDNCNAIIDIENGELIIGCAKTVIPDNVKIIGDAAFYNCTSLKNITIPTSVRTIRKNAFYGCLYLKNLVIPEKVTTIGQCAFYDCRRLESIVMPSNLKAIEEATFQNCCSLISIEIPKTVTRIERNAFNNCTSLITVDIPDSVTTIGYRAFEACINLESIKLSNNITTIADHTFCSCQKLLYIVIPNSVTKIENNAFRGCKELISVVALDNVKEIEDDVFTYTNENLVISVASGSAMQRYAIENVIKHKIYSITLDGYRIEKIADQTYTGGEIKPSIVVKSDSNTLALGRDYVVRYRNNTNIGTAGVTVIGVGVYTGSITNTFQIVQRPINNVKISNIANQTYTGKEIKPDIVVKDNENILQEGTDYLVEYTNNTNIGTAVIKVIGKGNYIGEKTVTFKIIERVVTVGVQENSLTYGNNATTKYEIKSNFAGKYRIEIRELPTGVTLSSDEINFEQIQNGEYKAEVQLNITNTAKASKTNLQLIIDNTITSNSFELKIDKAQAKMKELPQAKQVEYTGKEQELIIAGKTTDGTILYSLDKINYSEKIPVATQKGSYKVYYKVIGDENHLDLEVEEFIEAKIVEKPLEFKDVRIDDWYYNPIQYCYNRKILLGKNEFEFKPNDQLTRGQLVTIIWRMEGSPIVDDVNWFKDVKDWEYYHNAIIWATSKKIVSGYSKEKFGPKDNITREQLAVMLNNYAKYKKKDTSELEDISKFTDSKKVSSYAITAIQWAIKNKIISGKDEGTRIDPQGKATRGEASAMLQRYCQNIDKIK